MTDARTQTDTPEHSRRKRGGLFVNDTELIELLGVPEKEARRTIAMLDRDRKSGFPPKQKHWGDRRYKPAVMKWLDATGGLKIEAPQRSHQ